MKDLSRFGVRHLVTLAAAGAVACLIALSLFMSSEAAGTDTVNVKLSGEIQAKGDVHSPEADAWPFFKISPDSKYVAYIADSYADNAYELYVAGSAGGAPPIRVSGLLPAGSHVAAFDFTPDSSHLVYIAPQDTADVNELFVVPVSGGTPLKLNNSPFPSNADVDSFKISPDGSRVAYRANASYPYRDELYSVPIGGGPVVKISGPLNLGLLPGGVTEYAFSPDGLRVVYIAEQDAKNRFELFSTSPYASSVVKLNGQLATEGDVGGFAISPNSSHVVYRADQETDEAIELYSVPLFGGTSIKLNGQLVAGGDVWSFSISPDSSHVVYRADQQTDDVVELYSVPLAGGGIVKLSGLLVTGGDVWNFSISPDSSRVVYLADQQTFFVWELYSVPLTGGGIVKLNGPLVNEGDVSFGYLISSDSSRVVYLADQETDGIPALYSSALDGGVAIRLNETDLPEYYIADLKISPDSSYAVYRALLNEVYYELIQVPLVGGENVKLSGMMDAGPPSSEGVSGYDISPDGRVVVYRADQDTFGKLELYASFEDPAPTQWFTYLPSVLNR